MKNTNALLPGFLLRSERIRQGKGQKEICYGICVTSYLSKIERGQIQPNVDILSELFVRLGITYEHRKEVLEPYVSLIEEYFERLLYMRPTLDIYEKLSEQGDMLKYSELTADWQLIQIYEKWNRGEEIRSELASLEVLFDCMDKRQQGYFCALQAYTEPDKSLAVKLAKDACGLLENSFAMMTLCYQYISNSNFTAIHQMEQKLTAAALEEGNTYQLADYYRVKGSAYACLGMEDLMMTYYQRSANMLQGTIWEEELEGIYYNIGATCLEKSRNEEALRWLEKMSLRKDDLMTVHKLALAHIRLGQIAVGKEFLVRMKNLLDQNPSSLRADYLRYEEALMECEPDYLDDPNYLTLLEEMMKEMERSYHFGHLYSYRNQYMEAYKRQRKYKKALEFEEKISGILMKNSI